VGFATPGQCLLADRVREASMRILSVWTSAMAQRSWLLGVSVAAPALSLRSARPVGRRFGGTARTSWTVRLIGSLLT